MKAPDEKDVPEGVEQVLALIGKFHVPYQLRTFDSPAHHAHEAAALLGCPLGAIIKSLLFQSTSTGEMLLVLVSGENRADVDLLRDLTGQSVRPASPGEVLKRTGYAVGAVPPFGMQGVSQTIIDVDLMAWERVWGSAGSVNILLGIAPKDLQDLSHGRVEAIKLVREATTH